PRGLIRSCTSSALLLGYNQDLANCKWKMQRIELNFEDGCSRLKYGMLNGIKSDALNSGPPQQQCSRSWFSMFAFVPHCWSFRRRCLLVMVRDSSVSWSRLAVMASVPRCWSVIVLAQRVAKTLILGLRLPA
ncbi:hypothetical protein HAX54_001415, partial [Datura stramonium]|nr:hypothetical protein [Datura stramonium]